MFSDFVANLSDAVTADPFRAVISMREMGGGGVFYVKEGEIAIASTL